MKIISRNAAKTEGLKRYFTGKPCKHGHISDRKVSSHNCVACINEWNKKNSESGNRRSRLFYKENRDEQRIKQADYYQKNKEHLKNESVEYRKNNIQIVQKNNANYRENNQEKIISYRKKYNAENRGICNARGAKYRASKLSATPEWLTDTHIDEMQNLYKECEEISIDTGIKHHVDHIIPLQGKLVKGLHVPWNLQILTANENISKNNRVVIK